MEQVWSAWFTTNELALHRMESFHRGRVHAIESGDAPFHLKKGAKLVFHLIPPEAVRSGRRFTASDLKAHCKELRPLGEQSGRYRFNEDGYASYDREGEVGAFSQLHRDGRLEAVMTKAMYEQDGVRILRNGLCERAIFEVVGDYLRFCKGIGMDAPVWSFVALAGCKGVRGKTWDGIGDVEIQRPLIFLPEFEIESLDIDPVTHLRPLFNCLANAVGLEQSIYYDEQGNRREPRGH
jgi:hypothetical protein